MSQRQPAIRQATANDIPRMADLLAQLFAIEEDFVVDSVKQSQGLALLLASPQAHILVAEERGQLVGMITGQLVISTAQGTPSLWLEDLVVDQAWRGRQVGPTLLTALTTWATQHGASRLQLLADRNNASGLGFYQKTGWQNTSLICLRKFL